VSILVLDEVLDDPLAYRAHALGLEFKTYDFGHCQFHGIAVGLQTAGLIEKIAGVRPDLKPTLTFFRKSPAGQVEPHFIHTDIDMGEWSAILYLNPAPPLGDGTMFWEHRATGARESAIPHERSEDGKYVDRWLSRSLVRAKFNRLVLFPSSYFHSRAMFDNWGAGDEARLTQVVFGTGKL
jgi:hypothetical protein